MQNKSFSIGEAVKFGWDVVKNNLGLFISLVVIVLVIMSVMAFIGEVLEKMEAPWILRFFVSIISWLINIVLGMWQIRIALKFVDGQKGALSDFKEITPYFSNGILGNILYSLIILAGFLLLIIPGIIWAIKYQFVLYAVIDKQAKPVDALKLSGKVTNGVKFDLFLFGLLLALINLAGALLFIIGLLITIPLTIVAQTYVYRKLITQEEQQDTASQIASQTAPATSTSVAPPPSGVS